MWPYADCLIQCMHSTIFQFRMHKGNPFNLFRCERDQFQCKEPERDVNTEFTLIEKRTKKQSKWRYSWRMCIDGKKFKFCCELWGKRWWFCTLHMWKLIVLNALHCDLNLIFLQTFELLIEGSYSFEWNEISILFIEFLKYSANI